MLSDGPSTILDKVLYSSYFAHGFLPPCIPSSRLPETWTIWEDLLSDAVAKLGRDTQRTLQGIPESEPWRTSVQEMPVLPTKPFHSDQPNLLRARLVLTFLLHFYIHSAPKTPDAPIHIPPTISIPLRDVSRCVGLPPICTYSDTIYYNYSYSGVPESANNLQIHTTFTSTPDEVHFYRTQALIEHCGAEAMRIMRKVIDIVASPSPYSIGIVSTHLNELAVVIDEVNRVLCDVRTGCVPSVFYNQVRPWLPGAKLIFDGVRDGPDQVEEWVGSSAAQSSTIQALDAFLGIDELTHSSDTEYEAPKEGKPISYLTRMRTYIPEDHRVVLEGLSIFGKSLRSYIIRNSTPESPSLALVAYNSVINSMKDFRNAHIRVATLYIVSQRKGGKSVGTGGTDLVPFLRGVRDQTMRGLV